ncbi:hypothetical protein V5799_032708, partial [Amblyomma americanum]
MAFLTPVESCARHVKIPTSSTSVNLRYIRFIKEKIKLTREPLPRFIEKAEERVPGNERVPGDETVPGEKRTAEFGSIKDALARKDKENRRLRRELQAANELNRQLTSALLEKI